MDLKLSIIPHVSHLYIHSFIHSIFLSFFNHTIIHSRAISSCCNVFGCYFQQYFPTKLRWWMEVRRLCDLYSMHGWESWKQRISSAASSSFFILHSVSSSPSSSSSAAAASASRQQASKPCDWLMIDLWATLFHVPIYVHISIFIYWSSVLR